MCPVCDRKRCGCLEGGVFVAAVSDLDKKELRNERQGLSHAGQGKTRAVPMCRARAVLPYGKSIEAHPCVARAVLPT